MKCALSIFVLLVGRLCGQAYTEEAALRGVAVTPQTAVGFGAGAAFADFTGDGFPDLLVPGGFGLPVWFFVNDGTGSFLDRTVVSGLGPSGQARGVAVADVDGDGDLDAYVCRGGGEANALFRNDGTGTFTDDAAAAGVALGFNCYGAAFADVDRDGDLDLHVAVYGTGLTQNQPSDRNRLFINDGTGAFTEEGGPRGVANGGLSYMVSVLDFDRDGWPDLFVANDRGGQASQLPNALYRNLGDGTFADVSVATNTGFGIDGMGVDAGDVTGDGWDEIFVTNTPAGHLLHVYRPGTYDFVEEASVRGVALNRLGWGAVFHDRDNDGDLDLYVAHAASGGPLQNANAMLRNDGTGTFTDVSTLLQVGSVANAYGVAVADLEGDGDLDLFLPNGNQPCELFVNQLNGASGHLRVEVRGRSPNLSGIGARVDIDVGGVRQSRRIRSSVGYLCAGEPVASFGLGAAAVVDRVEVTFATGATAVRTQVAAGSTLVVEEPDVVFATPLTVGSTTAFVVAFPGEPGAPYAVLGSFPSTPRLWLASGRTLGFGWDAMAAWTAQGAVPLGQAFAGTLDGMGRATPSLTLPNDPALVGFSVRLGAVVVDVTAPELLRALDGGRVLTIN